MHGEALVMSLQTLALPAAPDLAQPPCTTSSAGGDVAHGGGWFVQGAQRGDERERFVFDNEKWAHDVELAPFRIGRAPVTQCELAAFVDDGGYARRELWSDAGWAWRVGENAKHPVHWRRGPEGWERRVFDG